MGNINSLPILDENEKRIFLDGKNDFVPYQIPKNNKLELINASRTEIKVLPLGLQHLTSLDLSFCKYMGPVPDEIIKAIVSYPSLSTLCLSFNEITVLPPEVLMKESLTRLEMTSNKLNDFDGSRMQLDSIDISQNRLTYFPSFNDGITSVCVDYNLINEVAIELPSLVRLSATLNKISRFTFKKTTENLFRIELKMNELRETPDFSVFAPQLRALDLSFNKLTEFPKLPSTVNEVDVSANEITVIPESIIELSNMTSFNCAMNKIKKLPKLPDSLQTLDAYENGLEEIESTVLPKLTKINVTRNKLTSYSLQSDIMYDLYIFKNNIKSIDGKSLSNNITLLNLSSNELTELPDEAFTLPKVQKIFFADNKIEKLPEKLKESTAITVSFSDNPIEKIENLSQNVGILICSFCRLSNVSPLADISILVVVDASGNSITEFPYIETLRRAHLSRNKLKKMPKFPEAMEILDLSCNEIEGEVSLNFPKLCDLDISHNNITSLNEVNLPKIISFKLSDNKQLTKELQFTQFPDLENVDVAETKVAFTDNIPAYLREIITDEGETTLQRKVIPANDALGFAEMKGFRPTQEDAIIAYSGLQCGANIFAVLDGHGGSKASNFAAYKIVDEIKKETEVNEGTLRKIIKFTGAEILKEGYPDGSTMALAVVQQKKLISALLGDSRTIVISESGEVRFHTIDHKPESREEFERVRDMGGFIMKRRIGNNLAVARSLGDSDVFGVGHDPEIRTYDIKEDDKWLIICCDGVYDVLENENIAKIAASAKSPIELAYDIRNRAYSLQSYDNISCIVYDLSKN